MNQYLVNPGSLNEILNNSQTFSSYLTTEFLFFKQNIWNKNVLELIWTTIIKSIEAPFRGLLFFHQWALSSLFHLMLVQLRARIPQTWGRQVFNVFFHACGLCILHHAQLTDVPSGGFITSNLQKLDPIYILYLEIPCGNSNWSI